MDLRPLLGTGIVRKGITQKGIVQKFALCSFNQLLQKRADVPPHKETQLMIMRVPLLKASMHPMPVRIPKGAHWKRELLLLIEKAYRPKEAE